MRQGKQMKALIKLIEEKKAERDKLNIEIAALEAGAKRMSGEPSIQKRRAPRSNVKNFVLQALEEFGAEGVNAASICEYAETKGRPLERGSVSSLLSRLKNEGITVYDGSLYRLAEYVGKADAGERSAEQQDLVH